MLIICSQAMGKSYTMKTHVDRANRSLTRCAALEIETHMMDIPKRERKEQRERERETSRKRKDRMRRAARALPEQSSSFTGLSPTFDRSPDPRPHKTKRGKTGKTGKMTFEAGFFFGGRNPQIGKPVDKRFCAFFAAA